MAKVMLLNWWFQIIAAGEAQNFWDAIKKFLADTKTNLTMVSWGVFVVAVIVAGIMFAFGRSASELAKSMIGKVIIGVILVSFAVAIISTIASMGGQTPSFG
jgi:type IV secretory pathway VirB2 component (pilin)